MIADAVAIAGAVWYIIVVLVCTIGYVQIWRHYSKQPPKATCLSRGHDASLPHVTIIRPVKGVEPFLYECLAATFQQTYPSSKLTVYFCVSSRNDPALPILEQLVKDFGASSDARVFIEEDDPVLQQYERDGRDFGPNPKIRNMSRAYREAKGDIMWIIDCNVWVGMGVAGRMVDMLYGYGGKRKNKFVHQLPLVVDTTGLSQPFMSDALSGSLNDTMESKPYDASQPPLSAGGRLEELFMSSSHAKFYTAINTVLVAPCIVGKSNMFRRSHLNALTEDQGTDYFSHNICEDHLIGDLLWKRPAPASIVEASKNECGPKEGRREEDGRDWGNHALLPSDPAIQPLENVSVREYFAKRTRWLRVRKFTVTLATLVEPGTESFLCSLYGAYAVTTLPVFRERLGIPPTWTSFILFWLSSVTIWTLVDWILYRRLHSALSIEVDEHTPLFARSAWAEKRHRPRRSFWEWLGAWLGREALAFPIWAWAVWGGVSVSWRGKEFWVGMDMRVHEILKDYQEPLNVASDRKKRI